MKRYHAIIATKDGNKYVGQVSESDVVEYNKKFTIVTTHTDEEARQIESQFKPFEVTGIVNGKKPVTTISKPSKYNYSLIPKKAINEIRKAYEAENHTKLHEYREKYKVASKCPSCQNIDTWNYRVWKRYFEVELKK